MKKIFNITTLLLLPFFITYGQDTDELIEMSLEDLMQMNLSVGSRTIKNPDQLPGAVTIIEKSQIKEMQARNLRDVLNVLVPGMDVVPTYFQYGNPVSEGIYSRGIISDFNQQILILFNGQNKFNESSFGSPYPGMDFTLENVDRIEINNSPAPLLGGGALVTINIVTKEQNLTGTEAFVNVGFNEESGLQSERFTANFGQYIGTWHVGSSIQYSTDKGQPHPDASTFGLNKVNGTSLNNGLRGGINFNLNIKSPNDKLEIGSWYKNVAKDAGFSNLNISQSNDLYDFHTITFHNYLKYQVSKELDLTAGVSTFNHINTFNLDRDIPVGVNQSVNIPFQNDLKNYNTFVSGGYLKEFSLLGFQTLFAGFKIEREGQNKHAQYQLDESTNNLVDVTQFNKDEFAIDLEDDDRTVYSLFAENNWNINSKLAFLYGFRWEYYDNFANTTISSFNPRLAISYLPSSNWILRALYSKAVRPPSIYEIEGNNFLPGLYGNRDLTFEKLESVEFSIKYKKSGFEINLNPYIQRFNDRITYVTSDIDNTALVATNSGELEVIGLEVNTKYSWGDHNYIFINGSKLDSKDKLLNQRTSYLPEFYLNGGLNFAFGKMNYNWTVFYRGDRSLPSNLVINKEKAGGSHLNTDIAVTYFLHDNIDVYLMIQNLLDSENNVPLSRDGFYVPLNGRIINVGLNLNF